jgi:hypothetical protein
MKTLFVTKNFVAALALALIMGATVAWVDDVKIKDVDNYAGNSNVYTNTPNATVTITELDYKGDSVQSWTGTTDAEGKITISAGHNLSKDYLKVKGASNNQQWQVEGIVVPDTIYGHQPFSFSVPNVTGEVNVLTADGVVVQRTFIDKYGRGFLASGLPSGAYQIAQASGDGHHAQPLGKIEVRQAIGNPQEPQQIQLIGRPKAVPLGQSFSLAGHGFSPNYAETQINLAGSGETQNARVLAATNDQLKLTPSEQAQPGVKQMKITNTATGQSTEPTPVLMYSIQKNIRRNKLTSGVDQTQLVVTTLPKDVPLNLRATVLSGPVDFGGGRKQADATTSNGQAIFPVYAERGSGEFHLGIELAPEQPGLTYAPISQADSARQQSPRTGNNEASQIASTVGDSAWHHVLMQDRPGKDKEVWGDIPTSPPDGNDWPKIITNAKSVLCWAAVTALAEEEVKNDKKKTADDKKKAKDAAAGAKEKADAELANLSDSDLNQMANAAQQDGYKEETAASNSATAAGVHENDSKNETNKDKEKELKDKAEKERADAAKHKKDAEHYRWKEKYIREALKAREPKPAKK